MDPRTQPSQTLVATDFEVEVGENDSAAQGGGENEARRAKSQGKLLEEAWQRGGQVHGSIDLGSALDGGDQGQQPVQWEEAQRLLANWLAAAAAATSRQHGGTAPQ